MSNKIKYSLGLAFSSILFFIMINNAVFWWITAFIKLVFIVSGIICAYNSLQYILRYIKAYNRKKKETVYTLLFRCGIRSSIVNLITVYRIFITPALLFLAFNESAAFKWLLLSAFITDALDGFLARHWKVTSKLGARLDSLADDFLFAVSLAALIYLHSEVIPDHIVAISILVLMFILKMIFLYFKHDKIISGMHTYLSKAAAFLQSLFFIHSIFFQPNNIFFYLAAIVTMLCLAEEIIIIYAFRELRQNIKGLFFIRSQM